MAIGQGSTITRGFLVADLRGYTDFVKQRHSTQQMVSIYRVDLEAADGAPDWVLVKQQDFGPPQ